MRLRVYEAKKLMPCHQCNAPTTMRREGGFLEYKYAAFCEECIKTARMMESLVTLTGAHDE